MKIRMIITILISVALLAGCKTKFMHLKVVSMHPYNKEDYANAIKGKKVIKGEDIASMIFIFPTGTPTVNKALEKAMKSEQDILALINVDIYTYYFFGFFYDRIGYIVEGTPIYRYKGKK